MDSIRIPFLSFSHFRRMAAAMGLWMTQLTHPPTCRLNYPAFQSLDAFSLQKNRWNLGLLGICELVAVLAPLAAAVQSDR